MVDTANEGILTDGDKTFLKCDLCKIGTSFECPLANGCDTARNGDALKVGAALEGIVLDGGGRIGNKNTRDLLLVPNKTGDKLACDRRRPVRDNKRTRMDRWLNGKHQQE